MKRVWPTEMRCARCFSEALGGLSLKEAVDLLASHSIVAGAVRSYRQVLESEDVRRLDLLHDNGVR